MENMEWTPTMEQLQKAIEEEKTKKAHPDNEDNFNVFLFNWAMKQITKKFKEQPDVL